MRSKSKDILIIGSYNGQDSLGDKCLLKAVSYRFNKLLKDGSKIYFHLHNPYELTNNLSDVPVVPNRGIQSLYWNWDSQLRRFRFPEDKRHQLSEKTFKWVYEIFHRFIKRKERALVDGQLAASAFMFVFGGTNFSKQWWWLNIVPYMLTAKIGKLPVYFGTQQYGPMLDWQQRRTQKFIKRFVKDVRFRNPACFKELGMQDSWNKLTKDEVYSNVDLYPNPTVRSGVENTKKIILINYRGTQDFLLENPEQEIHNLALVMNSLGERYDCDFMFFSVSGASFSDDTEAISKLRSLVRNDYLFNTLPYTDEFDLIETAKTAYACVSMSFHGCILAMIGGCPAIPLSSGDYYDHKYINFETYNSHSPIPVVYLSSPHDEHLLDKMCRYFDEYDFTAVNNERINSHKLIEDYYKSILKRHKLLD